MIIFIFNFYLQSWRQTELDELLPNLYDNLSASQSSFKFRLKELKERGQSNVIVWTGEFRLNSRVFGRLTITDLRLYYVRFSSFVLPKNNHFFVRYDVTSRMRNRHPRCETKQSIDVTLVRFRGEKNHQSSTAAFALADTSQSSFYFFFFSWNSSWDSLRPWKKTIRTKTIVFACLLYDV